MANYRYEFAPDAVVRSVGRVGKTLDGKKVAELNRGEVVRFLYHGWITVHPPPKKIASKNNEPIVDPWAKMESETPARRQGKHRKCMCCGGAMWSDHFGVRLCWVCRRENDW